MKKMLNFTNHWGNTSQYHKEIHFISIRWLLSKQNNTTEHKAEGMEQLELNPSVPLAVATRENRMVF